MSNDHGATYWCGQYHQLKAQSEAKILELEQRVKVLTDAIEDIADANYKQLRYTISQICKAALNQSPQQSPETDLDEALRRQ